MVEKKRLLFISTPVGALGSGVGGGVELTLANFAAELHRRAYDITVVAPAGSRLKNCTVVPTEGRLQVPAQSQSRQGAIEIPFNCVLPKMLEFAQTNQDQFDLILNFAYDWLPFYLTPTFRCPIAHLVSMSSLHDEMDRIITQVGRQHPGTVGVHTYSQAKTFPDRRIFTCLGNGIDLDRYQVAKTHDQDLAWVGRITPEKGLEDALAAAQVAGVKLRIFGQRVDSDYWHRLCVAFPEAIAAYRGFLPTEKLQQELGRCRALLMTPKWDEAFGNVVVEALACGVPVITYDRGGSAEIVKHGQTGWVVKPEFLTSPDSGL